jgi:hypothetical protein
MGSSSGSNRGSGSPGDTPSALAIALKVSFNLNTPDGLRQIFFELERDVEGVRVDWNITFKLYERTDRDGRFGDPIVSLNVFVASILHANAESAAQNGLTPAQTAHATGPAADAAKASQAGTMPLPVCNKIIQDTLR